MNQLNNTLDLYLVKKAPFQIPARWREVLVKWMPWIILVILLLALPAVLFLLGISAFVMPFAFMAGPSVGTGFSLAVVFLIATLVLEGMAIPGLLKRKAGAWNLLYYSALINAVYNLISFNIGGLILGTLINLYILFQIREYYK